MASRVVLNPSEVKSLLTGAQGPVFRILNQKANQVKNVAVSLAPVDQGKLRSSIASTVQNEGGQPVAYVGTNVDYAIYVHEGTGLYSKRNPRLIRPVRAKALRWPVKNQSGVGRRRYRGGQTAGYVFSKTSKGSPGRPFLTDALKRVFG